MASVERRSWWWTWLQVPGVGIGRLKQLEQAFGSLQAAWWAPAEQLLATPGVGPSLLAGRDQLQRNGSALPLPVPAKVLLPADAAMPAALKASRRRRCFGVVVAPCGRCCAASKPLP